MEQEQPVPRMLELWFGDAAQKVQPAASERLMGWCAAFDAWLDDLRLRYKPPSHKQALLAWRRLAHHCQKLPWELEKADIEEFAAWMQAQGFSVTTTANTLGYLASFYRWSGEHAVDGERGAGYNPAAQVTRPIVERYAGVKLLSRGEVNALLNILQRDKTPIGRRDYAFYLARLRLGLAHNYLQQLKWGQIELEAEGAWVRWRAAEAPSKLPAEIWEAIQDYLQASGRLQGMQADDYIFAPLVNLFSVGEGHAARHWSARCYVSTGELLANLKRYGRQVKIPDEKLTLMALMQTAICIHREEGHSLEEMQAFMGSREERRFTKYRLSKLPRLPEEQGGRHEDGHLPGEGEPSPPVHTGKPFKPGQGLLHGNYARELPALEVAEVVAEDVQGVEIEFVGLRILARRLMELQAQSTERTELANLMYAYSQATHWLEMLLKTEKLLDGSDQDDQEVEAFLAQLSEVAGESSQAAYLAMREETLGSKTELNAATRKGTEEIASTRLVLRRTFDLAIDNLQPRELIRYVNIYGYGCVRLVKLLKVEGNPKHNQAAYLQKCIEQAISRLAQDWDLDRDDQL